jgi:hypothetical protein
VRLLGLFLQLADLFLFGIPDERGLRRLKLASERVAELDFVVELVKIPVDPDVAYSAWEDIV